MNKKGRRKKVRFFRKKKPFRGKDSQRCFICRKKGHFSKNCPNKREKAAKLIHSLDLATDEDIESLYDEQDQLDTSTIFRLEYTNSDNSRKIDSSYSEEHFPVMQAEEIPTISDLRINSLDSTPPLPNVDIHILPSKYDIPIKAIAFMDTGAQKTLMNLAILLSSAWEASVHFFKAADGRIIRTDLITRHKIGIKFFLGCVIWTKVIGTDWPTKFSLLV